MTAPTVAARYTTQQWFRRGAALLGVLLVAAAVAGGIALAHTTSATNRLVNVITPAQLTAAQLRSSMIDQETGVRGYLLSDDPSFLAPYHDGLADERAQTASLRRTFHDDPTGLTALDAVGRQMDQWRSQSAEPIIAGRVTRADVALNASKQRFDDVRAALTDLDRHLAGLRDTSRAALRSATLVRNIVFPTILALVLAGGIALVIGLSQGVVRPLRRLSAATRQVAAGDFSRHVTPSGPADLRALATDVDGMRERILTELDEVRLVRDDLEQQAVELRRSNSELEQFAYVASHDLQEPLRKITSFCQLLERRYAADLDDRARQYIAFAVDGATRMQVLINDLLAFSRVGRVYDTTGRVDLETRFGVALTALRGAVDETDATVEHDALPTVEGDETLLTMLMQNLVSNAIKFRREGEPPKITLSCVRDGADWRFAVSDRGIGIAPEFADKVFVIFQRLHARDAYPGTGIGLAICKKVVEYHGGRIWVDPEYDDGARICFTLPAIDPSDDDTTADGGLGDDTTGSDTTGDSSTGDGSARDGSTGDGSSGDGSTGDQVSPAPTVDEDRT